MSHLRKLIWASWFIGTSLVLLSWLRLVSNDVGWCGSYIAGAGWLVSLATSRNSSFIRLNCEDTDESSRLDRQTACEYQASIDQLTRQMDNSPENRSALLASRGAFHRVLGNWDAAIADLDAALASNPDCGGNAYFDRSIALLNSGRPEPALLDVENAIAYFQNDDESYEQYEWARQWRHDILLKLERFDAVVENCDQILLEPTPDELATRLTRGIALTELGRIPESLNELSTVVDAFVEKEQDEESLISALQARAGAYLRAGEVEMALADIRRLQTIEGLTADNLSRMGVAEIQTNDYRAALNCYEKAVLLDPSMANNYFQLAIIQAGSPDDRFRDGPQAEVNARKACELTKWNDWNCISVLAAAKAELGEFDQAIEFAEWSLRIAPDREKKQRQERVDQFRDGKPFRIGEALPRTIYRRNSAES